jgi:CBS domain-containing protein
MLDYSDLTAYILEVFHKIPKEQPPIDTDMDVTDIVRRAQLDRQGVPIKLVSNISHRNPLVAVWSDSMLLDAIEEFARSGVHRVVVLERSEDPANPPKFIGVLSQSTVAALLARNFGKLYKIQSETSSPSTPRTAIVAADWATGNATLRDLGLVKGDVVSVASSDTVLEALYVMHTKGVSSVAIRDGTRLCGSVSMTDIKEILATRGGWRRLYEPAFRFFATVRSMQGLQSGGNDRVPSFTVHPTTTLMSAIEKMVATRTHRVWICNDESEVVGVVSLSDVMPWLLPTP